MLQISGAESLVRNVKHRMHTAANCLLLSFVVTLGGCMTRRSSEMFAYAIVHGVVGDAAQIPFWTQQFQSDKHRWPKDIKELDGFVSKQSGGRLGLTHYDRVSFEELANGQLHVRCFHGEMLATEYMFLTEAERCLTLRPTE